MANEHDEAVNALFVLACGHDIFGCYTPQLAILITQGGVGQMECTEDETHAYQDLVDVVVLETSNANLS